MINKLYKFKETSPDLKIRKLNNIYIIYFETLCDINNINDFILKPITLFSIKNSKDIFNKLPNGNLISVKDENELYELLFNGFTIIIVNKDIIAFETRIELNSSISEATNEKVIKGPKDAFTENYQINIGLIRKRIRSKNLVIKEQVIGTSSKTKISIIYMKDIVNNELLNKIEKNISKINLDYVANSNYIYESIDKSNNILPTNIMTERPDLTSFLLMEGRIALVVENSPEIVILPTFFYDFIKNIDDYYQNSKNVTITRIIRIISFVISIITPGLYIAITTFNQESLPTSVLINFSLQREGVPFPSIIEALIMLVSFEILREADTRIPYVIGTSMSIVGALVLGEAAVSAGLISPIMIIVIAISSVSSFIFNNNDFVNYIRIWKVLFLLFASFTGIYGIYICSILFLINLTSCKSYSFDYTYPASPFDLEAQKDNIYLNIKYIFNKRNKLITKNVKRR